MIKNIVKCIVSSNSLPKTSSEAFLGKQYWSEREKEKIAQSKERLMKKTKSTWELKMLERRTCANVSVMQFEKFERDRD